MRTFDLRVLDFCLELLADPGQPSVERLLTSTCLEDQFVKFLNDLDSHSYSIVCDHRALVSAK